MISELEFSSPWTVSTGKKHTGPFPQVLTTITDQRKSNPGPNFRLHTILKIIELPLVLPIHATNSTACQTEAHHEANHAQKWSPESSSPGQSRRPRPLGIRAPVAGAGAAGVLEPTLLLHRWHEAPSKSAPNPVKFASDSAPLQFGAREEPVGRGGGRDCSPGSDAGIGDEPRASRDRGRTKGRGATDRAHSSMWWGE